MKLVNIGCGDHYHSDWDNLELDSPYEDVICKDLRKGLPYQNEIVDACYSSHVLEHLTPEDARNFLSEQFRVLKSGGVIRVVVPDLEQIARNYLFSLEGLSSENADSLTAGRYEWNVVELFDQMVRSRSGGEMLRLFREAEFEQLDYIVERHGIDGERAISQSRGLDAYPRKKNRLSFRIRNKIKSCHQRILGIFLILFGGKSAGNTFRQGKFRESGEIHKWMYDRYSLPKLLKEIGFSNIVVCKADESCIAKFSQYELDVVGGRIRKPESLFVEALKP